jgi:diguanylate cyclase (GGDEF)-like protein
MLDFFYKEFPQYPKDHKDFWRTRLIAHALLVSSCYFLVLTLINLFYFTSYDIALIDALGLIVSLSIYTWFNKVGDVNKAAWAVTLMVVGLIMVFIVSVGGHSHTLFWATLIPPFTFFLVGRNWGSVLTAIAFTICAYLVYTQQQQTITIGLGSLFNIIEVSIAHILLFRFYEKTRFSAYYRLSIRNTEIQHLAETDKLTGLYNRQKFDSELSKLITQNNEQNTKKSYTLIICDIDFFKSVNDTYGHLVGDNVLKALANTLKKHLCNNALLARWGGEEFAIILSNTALDEAAKQADMLRMYIADHPIVNIPLTVSIGVTVMQKGDTVLNILERADKALYMAKNNGRNCIYTSDNIAHTA